MSVIYVRLKALMHMVLSYEQSHLFTLSYASRCVFLHDLDNKLLAAADCLLSCCCIGRYRVGPFEVESALVSHKAVLESAVVGSPDKERGTVRLTCHYLNCMLAR